MPVDALRILLNIAGHLDFRIESQNVAPVFFYPQRVPRDDRSSAMMCEFRECTPGAGLRSEKVDKHTFVDRRVLIDQDTDRSSRFERPENIARGISFADDVVTAERSMVFDQGIEPQIIQRSDDDVHRRRHPRMRKRTQFPIPEVRRGHQDATSTGQRTGEILQTVVMDPIVDVVALDRWKPGKRYQHPRDGAEHSVNHAWVRDFRDFKVSSCGSSQPGDGNVEHLDVNPRQGREKSDSSERESGEPVFERSHYSIQPPPSTSSPE